MRTTRLNTGKLKAAIVIVLFSVAINLNLRAAESTGADFLLAEPDARTAALSGAFCAVADDANAVLYNPAGLVLPAQNIISLTHFSSFADTNYEYITAVVPHGSLAFGASAMYDYTADFSWIGADGENKGNVQNGDFLLTGAAGYKILPGISAGACIKYFRSTILDYSKAGIALDFGGLAKIGKNPDMYFGIALQNIGSQTAYETLSEPLPVNLKTGVSVRFNITDYCRVIADLDINKIETINEPPDIGAGAELCFFNIFCLEAGYGVKQDGNNVSLGAGIFLMRAARISYAFQPVSDLGINNRISADIFF